MRHNQLIQSNFYAASACRKQIRDAYSGRDQSVFTVCDVKYFQF